MSNKISNSLIILLNMSEKEKVKVILRQIQKLRLKNQISSQKLNDYLYYIHTKVVSQEYSLFSCGFCGTTINRASPEFKRAFKTLSNLQKANFYLLNVKNIDLILNSDAKKLQNLNQKTQQYPKKIKLVFKTGSFIKKQVTLNVEVLQKQKILKIVQNKIEIDLHNYLLRSSKNVKNNQFVLEATQSGPLGNTIRLCEYEIGHVQVKEIIKRLWQEAQKQNIEDLLKTTRNSTNVRKYKKLKSSILSEIQDVEQTKATFNSSRKSIMKNTESLDVDLTNFQDAKTLQIINTFVSFDRYQQVGFGQFHQKNGPRVRKLFQLTNTKRSVQSIVKAIQDIQQIKRRKPTIKYIKHTENKKWQKIHVQQTHQFSQTQIKFSYERTQFIHHASNYIIQKTQTQKIINKKQQKSIYPSPYIQIQHCIWRIRQICNQIDIFVQACINYQIKSDKGFKKTRKYTSMFIGQLCKLMDQHCYANKFKQTFQEQFYDCNMQAITQYNLSQNFYTIPGSIDEQENTMVQKKQQSIINQQLNISQVSQSQLQFGKKISIKSDSLTHHKFIVYPQPKQAVNKIKQVNKGHWLFQNQWVVKDTGDLVNVNQQKINVQSSVLKLVIKRMSKNLFSGKSILNTSLPIQIFGVDSNLQRLVKGYIFAPKFLQKASKTQNRLERLKNVICFQIGFSLSYITMQKPFNPILGQTYQGIVDGCPVYGQQISHHPPISSIYMVGRGYKCYGSLQAKVQMGFNTAAGINQGFNIVEFDDGQKIKFTCPPGELSGLVYGDRKVSVNKKSYYIDKENRLLCIIQWGKNKSRKELISSFNDFFCGKINKMKQNFDFSNYKNHKKQQIQQLMGQITGRFFQKVCFNQDVLFDIQTQAPSQMQDYTPCLMSDSRNRKDIIHRKQCNFTLAQQAKQQLQVFQRNDKRLRHQNIKNAH